MDNSVSILLFNELRAEGGECRFGKMDWSELVWIIEN